ncbi:MAG: hypothetical protein AB2693_11760, partial [Candidatus Thiodiazotropha sp.]
MLLQDMWVAGLEWDEEMDESLSNPARAWFTELHELDHIQIPRCLQKKEQYADTVSLHTFVDASERAYGAVVYARHCYEDGSVSINIVAAKTRVAPTVATSIPRLELMGAVVGVRLATKISSVLEIPTNRAVFWSDSVNVLYWIRGRSRQFKLFVANRVGEIQSSTDPEQWRYVPTSVNPADLLSRGMRASELKNSGTWWRGPDFLCKSEELWPSNIIDKPAVNNELKGSMESQKKSVLRTPGDIYPVDEEVFHVFVTTDDEVVSFPVDPNRYSSWLRLRRILAWVYRFIRNCQTNKQERTRGDLLNDELKTAEIQIIKQTQRTEFNDEWIALAHGKPLSKSSKLIGLQPKIDEDGLMRSDGRLKYAEFLSFDVRFPIILPRKSSVTKLIVKEYHEKGKHVSGTNHTLAA